MSGESLVIGVDGGGSTTRAALVDAIGRVLGLGYAGPSNYDDVGVGVAEENIGRAVSAAWHATGQAFRPADAAFFGMAGVVSDADRAAIRGMARALDIAPAECVGVDHDIRIALAGGLGGREGIALIVGTGSSCYGRRADGRAWRAGGWGYLLDDLGGGYYLGLHGLIALTRAADGRGVATALTEPLLAALRLTDPQDIMHRLYHAGLDGSSGGMTRADIATLAPLVLDAAIAGDAVATEIVERGVDELALMVATVARALEFDAAGATVTAVGGLAQSGAAFKQWLYPAIRRRAPRADIVEPALSPVLGAALLALEMCGVAPSDAVIERLRRPCEDDDRRME
ncbi:MAG: BadF/BadG/BcrA/BcrD ATPase family protein [Anaerolineae bacterium]